MTNNLRPIPNGQPQGDIIESVIAKGDLAKLTPGERNWYYREVCRSLGLNPLTQPFAYIPLNGKLTLYAKRDCADQLRKLHSISIEIVSREIADGLMTVHVRAKDGTGRVDEDFGVVALPDTLKGEGRANAILKAGTKAKRRVTLSISGLGFLDQTEIDDIPREAKGQPFDPETGEVANYTNDTPSAQELIEPPSKEEEAKMAAERGRVAFQTFCARLAKVEYAGMKQFLETLKPIVERVEG